MKHVLLIAISLLIGGCTNKQSSNTSLTIETDSISKSLTYSLTQKSKKEGCMPNKIDTTCTPEPSTLVLEPVVVKEFNGKLIPSDLLVLKTEFEYYPLSTTEIKLLVQNYAETDYTTGEPYSIAYYDTKEEQWEPYLYIP